MATATPAMAPFESLWPGEDGNAGAEDVTAGGMDVEDVDVEDVSVEDIGVEDVDVEDVAVKDMDTENDGLKIVNNVGCDVAVVASVSAPVVSGSGVPYTSWEPYGEVKGYTRYDMLGILRSYQGKVV